MVDDGEPQRVRPGDTVFIPKGAFHSTINTGYEPMVILAIYAPAGAEEVLKTLPDYEEVAGGRAARTSRAGEGRQGAQRLNHAVAADDCDEMLAIGA